MNLFDEGHDLLKEMLKEGVAPSNFTLSIMVKLLNRARKVEQAFSLVKEITEQYKFKANVHVYTNLMQGCNAINLGDFHDQQYFQASPMPPAPWL